MSNQNSRRFSRREAADILIRSARIYHEHFAGVVFLYAFQGKYIEVQFRPDNFKHLSGASSRLHASEFFTIARQGKSRSLQLNFSDWHFRTYFPRKSRYIDKLHQLTIGDCKVVATIDTKSKQFEFGLTDCNFTIGLSKNVDTKGKLRNLYLVPYSLREGDGRSISRETYPVDFVLRKRIGQKQYDTVCYINPKYKGQDSKALSEQMTPNIANIVKDFANLKKWQVARRAFLETMIKALPYARTNQKNEVETVLVRSARQALLHDGMQEDVKDDIEKYAPMIVRDRKDFAQSILDKALQMPDVVKLIHSGERAIQSQLPRLGN